MIQPTSPPRNELTFTLERRELEAEEGGLFAEVFLAALAVEFFFLGEDGGVIRAAVFDEVVEDAGQLVGGGRDGFRRTEAGFHAAEVIAKGRLATLQALGGHAQSVGGAAFDVARRGGEDTAACSPALLPPLSLPPPR